MLRRNRNRRTVFLGVLATATFAWSAIYQFDVPAAELGWLLVYCVLGVATVALLAAVCVATLVLLGKLKRVLFSRDQDVSN